MRFLLFTLPSPFARTQTPNDTALVCVSTKSTKVPFLGPEGAVTGDLVT